MPEGSRKKTLPPTGAPDPAAAGALPLLAGRFDLLQELGSGASGTVHRARLREDYRGLPAGSEVAVKFLRQDRMDDENARRSLLLEGRLGLRVRHDNLARIHGIETLELLGLDVVYLVMELIEGTTLRKFLAESGPAVDDLTRRIGADAAAGLHALHRNGIVHRDVKPDNLVLTPDGQIKVVDLGLARAVDGGPGSPSYGGIAGSVAYAAPEVLRGRPARPESDLYGLGVVLFEVATGRHPFTECTSVDEMIDAHLHREPPRASHFRPRISALLEQVIAELLHKQPDLRFGKAAELSAILHQGERSRWWRSHEDRAPALASRRLLRRWRRPADTTFRDRDVQRELLDRALAGARSGAGCCNCLTGPDGIGRRRLLDECMSRWLHEHDDLLYLGGEADPEPLTDRGLPFGRTLLDHFLRGDAPDSPHAEARLLVRLQEEPGLTPAEAQPLAAALLQPQSLPLEVRADLIARALLTLTQRRTLVLRVERADQLDTGGRLVLRRLAEEAGNCPLLILAVAGVDGLPAPDEIPHERLELAGLSWAAFVALGFELFREGAVTEAFLEQAFAALAGSPGNLMEALEHMTQEGELRGVAGDYHGLAADQPFRPAPPHLARFADRVTGLPEEQRFVLQAAAVLGARFPTSDLAQLVGQTQLQVLETLSLFRGRVIAVQGGEATFRHRDFRIALLRRIPDAVRRRLHRQAAWILEDRGAGPLAVGLHLSRAQEHQACLDPLLQGLGELVEIGSRRSSLRVAGHLRVHLSHVADDEANRRRRLRYLLLSARARTRAMQPVPAERLLGEALDLSRELEDRAAHGEALTGLAFLALDGGRLLAALDLLEQAHVQLAPLDEDRGRALAAAAHATHGRALGHLGRAEDGLRHLNSALAAVPPEATELRCNLRVDLARLQVLGCHFSTAWKTFGRVDNELKGRSLPLVQTRLWLYRGRLRTWLGDDAGVEDLRRAHAQARQLSSLRHSARALLYLADRALWRGRREAAAPLLREAVGEANLAGDSLTSAMAAVLLQGLSQGSSLSRQELSERVEQLGSPAVQAAWLLVEAERHRREDRPDFERICLDEALDLERELDLPFRLRLRVLVACNRAAAAQRLVQSIAARLPSRSLRRRFVTANK